MERSRSDKTETETETRLKEMVERLTAELQEFQARGDERKSPNSHQVCYIVSPDAGAQSIKPSIKCEDVNIPSIRQVSYREYSAFKHSIARKSGTLHQI